MRPAVLGAGLAAGWSVPALAPLVPSLCAPLGLARRLADPAPEIGLTFDDGPHPQGTPAVLEALAAAGARATFFVVGEQVERTPALIGEILAAGHEVQLHGYRHRCLLRLAPRALAEDLRRGAAIVADATGREPHLYRPPYGIASPAQLAFARHRGWTTVLWSQWGRDWRRHITPESIARRAMGSGSAGDIVLLHDADTYSARDSWRRTVAALPRILDAIASRGLRAVAIEDRRLSR